MINVVTSVTVWNDSVGKRMSITYSEIDEETGKIISDNNREDKVITDKGTKGKIDDLIEIAQSMIDAE